MRSLDTLPVLRIGDGYWRERGRYLAQLYAQHGPVVRALLGRTEVVFLLGPEANRYLLQTHRHLFSHREGWAWIFGRDAEPPDLLTMDDPAHAWHRRLLHPAFAARRLEGYRPLMTTAIDRRLATWAARREIDLYEEARVVTFDVAAETILGLRDPADLALARAVFLHGAHRRRDEFAALLRQRTAERRHTPGDDALSLLADGRDEHGCPFGEAQIRAHAEVIVIAGHETSASLAAWTLYLLIEHPAYAEGVLEEVAHCPAAALAALHTLPRLDRALREAERLYAPVSVVPRVLAQAGAVGGYRLPAGTRVLYSAAATHLLPDLWHDPERFDPERFAPPREEHKGVPYALLGFGGGPRACIGRSVARSMLGLFVTRALSRYTLTLVPGHPIVQRYGVTNRPLQGIRVTVRLR